MCWTSKYCSLRPILLRSRWEGTVIRLLLATGNATRSLGNRAERLLADSSLPFGRVEFGEFYPADKQALESMKPGSYDLLVNFLSPRLIPGWALEYFSSGGINFHPGTPKFPGVGSATLAVYHGEWEFGSVAHYMSEKFDDGPIVWASTFPVSAEATPEQLNRAAHESCLQLFARLVGWLEMYGRAPDADAQLRWLRPAVTRPEFTRFLELGALPLTADVQRKIRAASYPGKPGAFVSVGHHRFYLRNDQPRD